MPTKEQREFVESSAASQARVQDICALVINPNTGKAVSLQTLYNNFSEELERGHARRNIGVGKFLTEVASGKRDASGPQISAAIFYAKCHMHWRQVDRMELTGANGTPLVVGARESLQSKIDRLVEQRGENVVPLRSNGP